MPKPNRFWFIAGVLIAILAFVQISSMLGETQTWDEGIHLVAGYSYLVTGNYSLNSEHPALAKMLCALPVLALRPNFDPAWLEIHPVNAGVNFLYLNRVSPDLILGTARSVTVLLTLLFAAWIAWWTRLHFGPAAALIALAFFCFDPNIIAHGRYVTTDLAACFFIFLASTLWIDYLLDPGIERLVLAGTALGAALCSKYSAIFLVPLFMFSGLARRRFRHTAYVLLIAAAVCVLVYLPEVRNFGSADPLQNHLTRTTALSHTLDWLGRTLHLPASNYLIGLDRLADHNFSGHSSYLLGQVSDSGWWYYFPVALLVKSPIGVLLAIVVVAALLWKVREKRFVVAALAVVPLVFFAFCLTSRINIGHRHILPIYPFLYVLAGIVLAQRRWLTAALLALVAVESLSIYPHYLAFFNWAAGGPSNGPKYLLDSNLDWGQGIKKLGRYMKDHHTGPVCLCFFGNVDVVRYGVNFQGFAPNPPDSDCVAAVSATPLFGLYTPMERFNWLRSRTPMARVGYSIYLYDLRKNR